MVNLKVSLGTVNYTDWLRITASKISSPGVLAYEAWINVPVTNYNFVIPNLDPENYYIRAYDAPTNIAPGTLVIELLANALTNEFLYERRFYTCDGPGPYDPVNGATGITDPYLIGKNVTGSFKEAFRYLVPTVETTFNDVTGNLEMINGDQFSTDEVFAVEIKYAAGVIAASSGGLYNGTLDITTLTHTLLASDRNKRIRLRGTGTTQVVTLTALAALTDEDGFYFDNTSGGKAIQVKLLLNGTDRIRFTGFMAWDNDMTAIDELAEFWVSRGEHLLIRKVSAAYWEVILDYKGTDVGTRQSGIYKGQAGWLPENGMLVNGDEYPRLWWWINTKLGPTGYVTDDAAITSGVHPANKKGLYILPTTGKIFRMPNTQELSEKGLKNFTVYGTDATRQHDYPGGQQGQKVQKHRHFGVIPAVVANGTGPTPVTTVVSQNDTGPGDFKYIMYAQNLEPSVSRSSLPKDATTGVANDSDFNIVNNFGVIFMVKI